MSGPLPPPLPAGTIRLWALPMAESRTAAYALVREAGPVVRGPRGGHLVVSAQAVEFVLKHPELFSSKRAFDAVGSPLPMVPARSPAGASAT